MEVLLRLTLCLTMLFCSVPVYGMPLKGMCCTQASNASKATCCSSETNEQSCCCKSEQGAVRDQSDAVASCCSLVTDSGSYESPANRSFDSEVLVSHHSHCGGDQCPCATQGCCVTTTTTVLLVYQSATSFVSPDGPSAGLVVGEDAFESRGDKPLLPPPKVLA